MCCGCGSGGDVRVTPKNTQPVLYKCYRCQSSNQAYAYTTIMNRIINDNGTVYYLNVHIVDWQDMVRYRAFINTEGFDYERICDEFEYDSGTESEKEEDMMFIRGGKCYVSFYNNNDYESDAEESIEDFIEYDYNGTVEEGAHGFRDYTLDMLFDSATNF
jgi:hypothetical protein